MIRCFRLIVVAALLTSAILVCAQTTKKAGVLSVQELKKLAPTSFYFDGQAAPVQLRNASAFRVESGKMVLAGMVDTSGYASDIQQKYQGFLITETKLKIEDSELNPGEYGFGFTKDGKFIVMDVAANDLVSVSANSDDKMAHPVPLKIVEENGAYKFYAGRKWVTLKPE